LIRVGYKLPILNKDVKNFRMVARRRHDFISGTLSTDAKLYSTGCCLNVYPARSPTCQSLVRRAGASAKAGERDKMRGPLIKKLDAFVLEEVDFGAPIGLE